MRAPLATPAADRAWDSWLILVRISPPVHALPPAICTMGRFASRFRALMIGDTPWAAGCIGLASVIGVILGSSGR